MFTPQQIDQISFSRVAFGGYDMQAVDEFLEPLTEDYVTLYKENALLKSKMKVLVGKLEEYRKNEASMKDAIVNAQMTCDKMVREAEAKCAQILNEANAAAAQNARNAEALIAAEDARVDEARRIAAERISQLQAQIQACIQALEEIKAANAPTSPAAPSAPAASGNTAFDFDQIEGSDTPQSAADAVAQEISDNLEALVGTADEPAPKAEPQHPTTDSTTSKFANLQFGRNYDPTHH